MQSIARGSAVKLGRKFCAALVLAFLCAGQLNCARAELTVETHDLLQFDYQQVGANEEEAIRLACIRAIRATVGRLLLSDYSLQARDLLESYLAKNWNQFTASYYVLERRFDRDGFGTRIRVQTHPERLTRDLREKKFLYLARPNPYYAVFLTETVDGAIGTNDFGRQSIIETLKNEGLNTQESVVMVPVNNMAVTDNPQMLTDARVAAIKAGAEVMIAGRADTARVAQQAVLLDNISTFETKLRLDVIRVDDGRVMASINTAMRASDVDAGVARSQSIQKSLSEATKDLLIETRGVWEKEVTDKAANFTLMFTDLTEEEADKMARHLQTFLSHGSQVHLKSWFGNVAIFNLTTDRQWAAVERGLIGFEQYDLRVTDRQGKRITVDVQH